MRNLSECKAEVFRRSQERIKARKRRRNRVLAGCIPACLCVAVCAAVILPGMGRNGAPESNGTAGGVTMQPLSGAGMNAGTGENIPEDGDIYGFRPSDPPLNSEPPRMTLYLADSKSVQLTPEDSLTLAEILGKLSYDPEMVCRCLPQYRVETASGAIYGIHLTEGFVRCDGGQAELTRTQIDTVSGIISWAKSQAE